MSKLKFGARINWGRVEVFSSEITSGTDYVVFWKDKVGGTMVGASEVEFVKESLEETIAAFRSALESQRADHAARLARTDLQIESLSSFTASNT